MATQRLGPLRTLWAVTISLSSACAVMWLILVWLNALEWLQDAFLNIAVTSIAIPFTAVIVENLVERHERERWSKVDLRGRAKAAGLGWRVADSIAQALGIPANASSPLTWTREQKIEFQSHNLGMLALIEHRLLTSIPAMSRVPVQRRDVLTRRFADLRAEANQVVVVFGRGLSPETHDVVLELEDLLGTALLQFPMWWHIQDEFDSHWETNGMCPPDDVIPTSLMMGSYAGAMLLASAAMLRSATGRADLNGL